MADDEAQKEPADQTGISSTGRRYHRRTGDIHEVEESSHVWLVSFTDVMALMLTFFVLLFSMTAPAKEEWSEITSSIQSEFNKFYGAPVSKGPQDAINIDKINFNRALNIKYLSTVIEAVIADSQYLEKVVLIPQPDSIIISLPRELLFNAGDATVREEGARALYALGGQLSRIRNKIEIIGHADPRPVGATSTGFDSNWDLSMSRAANVAAILESVGYQNDITIHGLSSGRYEDLQGIVDEEKRLDLARRVDIVVMNHDGAAQRVFLDPAKN
ncbi:MAG: flagellar motor protein MotB [Alphaproteobacteria bacterium CG_4_9_14_3_um_filter_47_13]|nr:MAG: flagellar motor protein MotB [Alphaproteobacteria bacterium CG_4_9_14_3_um_filter_47_13]